MSPCRCYIIMNSPSPLDRMNKYKGSSFPPPFIPFIGAGLGVALPYVLVQQGLVLVTTSPNDHDAKLLQIMPTFGYVALLFLMEFLLGAVARSSSPKASFSPAGAAASGQNPFAIVRANRIHQNHMESLCMLAPSAMAAVSVGGDANWIAAAIVSWVVFRVVYRLGYCYEPNPFWRICGVAGSLVQCLICLWTWWTHSTGTV